MTKGSIQGVITALVTPFQENGAIDEAAYRTLLADQKSAGVSAVIPCGTTGETPTLTKDEKKWLIQTAVETLKGSAVRVIAGTGSNSTAESVEFSKWASDLGVAGVLVVTPYYNKPSQTGMELHFRAVADAVKCEVVLYNVPGRTGVSLAPSTIVKLAEHPRITALKEATGNVAFTSECLDLLGRHGKALNIVSGDDATYLPLLAVGAVGVISVASNLFPRGMVAIQSAMDDGNLVRARELHKKYYPLFRDLFVDSNPVPVKYAMERIGLCPSTVRAPLAPLSPADRSKVDESLQRCELERGSRA